MRFLTLACGAIAGALVFMPDDASASGYSVARFGGEHGHPTTTNATALFYNPGALTGGDGTRIFVDVNLALRSVSYEHDAAPSDVPEPAGAEGANTGKANLFNFVASPMIGITTKLGDLVLGAGFFTPYGGQSGWQKNDDFEDDPNFPGPVDGVQRWYSIEGRLVSSFISLGAAYEIPGSGLSIGVAGNLIRSNVNTLRAREPSGTNDISIEGRSLLDASGVDWSFGAGLMYEAIAEKLWIGASYQSRPNVSGGMKLDGTLRNNFVGNLSDDPVDFHTDLPDVYRLGGRFRASEEVELRLFGDYTRWSVLENQCLGTENEPCETDADGSNASGASTLQNQRRDWKDTFGVRGGASYWLSPKVELIGGLGFSSNAVPDETLEPALADWDSLSAAVGGRFGLADSVFVATTYTQIVSLPRDTNGKNELSSLQGPSAGPDSGGKYKQLISVLNVNAELIF